MIRAVTENADGGRTVLLGLDAQNLARLREGQPVRVNLRQLDPDGPPVEELPDVEVVVFFAGSEERAALEQLARRQGML